MADLPESSPMLKCSPVGIYPRLSQSREGMLLDKRHVQSVVSTIESGEAPHYQMTHISSSTDASPADNEYQQRIPPLMSGQNVQESALSDLDGFV